MKNQNKIIELKNLKVQLTELKKQNNVIVQAHGVFDMLHVGHIRHLELAKNQGDILIVTVTVDKYVNKGPNRPVFDQDLRIYALAALEFVDFVCLSKFPTSVEIINILHPDIFVKGEEFKTNEDVTGGIIKEANAVQSFGGKVKYLGDIIFSSSNLINNFNNNRNKKQNDYLKHIKSCYSLEEILSWLDKLTDAKVVVIGETILEEYVYCEGMGQSLKDPVLTVSKQNTDYHPGGALLVAKILSTFVSQVSLITDIGKLENIIVDKNMIKENIKLINCNGHNYSHRQKIIDNDSGNKILEIVSYNDMQSKTKKTDILSSINDQIVFISDHGFGLIDSKFAKNICEKSAYIALNIQCNPENRGVNSIKKYDKANHCCMSGHELDLDIRTKNELVKNSINEFSKLIDCINLTVTNGKNGTQHISRNKKQILTPAFANKVQDRVGAVDVVFAISSLLVKAGASWDIVGLMSNLASAIHIAENGNLNTVNKENLIRYTTSILK